MTISSIYMDPKPNGPGPYKRKERKSLPREGHRKMKAKIAGM